MVIFLLFVMDAQLKQPEKKGKDTKYKAACGRREREEVDFNTKNLLNLLAISSTKFLLLSTKIIAVSIVNLSKIVFFLLPFCFCRCSEQCFIYTE
jgi:hypothetical protein